MPSIKPINYKRLVRIFEKSGFVCVHEEGDHLIFVKDGIIRPVIIPRYHSVPIFIIKNNLRTGKISRDEYFKLLEK
jgi:predicted RNA binding protein YcfA (HicA-like mRNA interferase family)